MHHCKAGPHSCRCLRQISNGIWCNTELVHYI
nr:MAG TPA: hypothetical protein [Caudoviricetes sp.]